MLVAVHDDHAEQYFGPLKTAMNRMYTVEMVGYSQDC